MVFDDYREWMDVLKRNKMRGAICVYHKINVQVRFCVH